MKIAFGCDPNAQEFKMELMEYVKGLGHETGDFGSEDPIYANTAIAVAKAVAAKKNMIAESLYVEQESVYLSLQTK